MEWQKIEESAQIAKIENTLNIFIPMGKICWDWKSDSIKEQKEEKQGIAW